MKAFSIEGFFVEPEPEEPCYGECSECRRKGEVWQRGVTWLCWRCVEVTA